MPPPHPPPPPPPPPPLLWTILFTNAGGECQTINLSFEAFDDIIVYSFGIDSFMIAALLKIQGLVEYK